MSAGFESNTGKKGRFPMMGLQWEISITHHGFSHSHNDVKLQHRPVSRNGQNPSHKRGFFHKVHSAVLKHSAVFLAFPMLLYTEPTQWVIITSHAVNYSRPAL